MSAAMKRNTKLPSKPLHHSSIQEFQSTTEWKGPPIVSSVWSPKVNTAFKLLLSFRLTSAIWSNISDCDETYNYWEPAHYLMYGQGFQTWEYSPLYAIRSYAYIALHLIPIRLLQMFTNVDKIAVFYLVRCLLALACAAAETYFYRGVMKHFGAAVSRLTLAFMLLSTGMFISSAAFLPSSFSMYMTLVSMGAWYSGHLPIAIVATAVSTFLGWPFAALLGVPIAIDILFRRGLLRMFFGWCVASCILMLLPMVLYDTDMFGKLVIAPANIVLYNVLTDHGPNLYGTEPWSFYFINGFLNFNLVFLLALPCLAVLYVTQLITKLKFPGIPHWLYTLPMYLWILVFFTQPHKEERFLFPIYPLFCFLAAVTLDSLQRLMVHIVGIKRHYTQVTYWLSLIVITLFGLLSLSRGLALYHGYHAPLDLYLSLRKVAENKTIHNLAPNKPVHVCVGKEWYRFPNSFFLPTEKWRLKFIESEFRGQLPAEYLQGPDATKVIPDHMNDMNREERSRYIDISKCHYLVDLDLNTSTPREPNYADNTDQWETILNYSFLDHSKSHPIFRAFYVPYMTEKKCKFGNYVLLKTKNRQKNK